MVGFSAGASEHAHLMYVHAHACLYSISRVSGSPVKHDNVDHTTNCIIMHGSNHGYGDVSMLC